MAAETKENHFDLIVLGCGSAGSAAARRAAEYGAKVLVFEQARYGGTCVNVGCVPKKIMFMTSTLGTAIKHHASYYGFNFDQSTLTFDLKGLKERRDAYVKRLNGIYERNLDNAKIKHIEAHATFENENTIVASKIDPKTNKNVYEGQKWTGDKILIAVGGFPFIPNIAGKEYVATSDDFFNKLDFVPKKTCIVGAGYIAVELAQVLQGIGSEVHLFTRHGYALRKFDRMIQCGVYDTLKHSGVTIHSNSNITAITKLDNKNDENRDEYQVTLKENDGKIDGFDYILYAIGRGPNQEELGLQNVPNVKQDKRGFVISDEWEQTGQKGIYAIGDINNKIALTPVAIRAGRFFSDREFGGKKDSKMDYVNVPSVIFSEPPCGSIGYGEHEVNELVKKGDLPEPIRVYETHFRGMYYGIMDDKVKNWTHMKIICVGDNQKVVGLHVMGEGADEMLQGFGVAIKMGATKADIDSVCAIHPTAAEEVVTLKKPRTGDMYSYKYVHEKEQKEDK